ncbi:hypothetical protein LSH36_65g06022 [Paralvinella palmiformis]|uniref:Ig-like domain-containing protein n=1 Tax=Paralvinella palmiformis TaxID=53620 RepID=A0AAD9NBX5_9ANNE|nr:hypothetical protein LSH36_65g06022 [Paralvinella palmiformis]
MRANVWLTFVVDLVVSTTWISGDEITKQLRVRVGNNATWSEEFANLKYVALQRRNRDDWIDLWSDNTREIGLLYGNVFGGFLVRVEQLRGDDTKRIRVTFFFVGPRDGGLYRVRVGTSSNISDKFIRLVVIQERPAKPILTAKVDVNGTTLTCRSPDDGDERPELDYRWSSDDDRYDRLEPANGNVRIEKPTAGDVLTTIYCSAREANGSRWSEASDVFVQVLAHSCRVLSTGGAGGGRECADRWFVVVGQVLTDQHPGGKDGSAHSVTTLDQTPPGSISSEPSSGRSVLRTLNDEVDLTGGSIATKLLLLLLLLLSVGTILVLSFRRCDGKRCSTTSTTRRAPWSRSSRSISSSTHTANVGRLIRTDGDYLEILPDRLFERRNSDTRRFPRRVDSQIVSHSVTYDQIRPEYV